MTNLMNIDLTSLKSTELKNLAKEFKVKNWWLLNKSSLVSALVEIKLGQEDDEAVRKANEEHQKELQKKDQETEESFNGKAKTTRKPKAPKVEKDQDNLVTIKELAAEYGMKGTKARRLLRNETAARPFGGNRWEWDKELHKEALDKARAILKAHSK